MLYNEGMVEYWSKSENEEDDIVETLIKLPIRNLEERIKLFENEIRRRKKLSGYAIARLGTQQLQLEERIKQLRYSMGWGESLNINLKSQYINLEIQKLKEMIDCFKDISKLEEKLLSTKGELDMERLKSSLIK